MFQMFSIFFTIFPFVNKVTPFVNKVTSININSQSGSCHYRDSLLRALLTLKSEKTAATSSFFKSILLLDLEDVSDDDIIVEYGYIVC